MELIFLEYFFPRLIPHKVKIALSGRYYWKLFNAVGQYGLNNVFGSIGAFFEDFPLIKVIIADRCFLSENIV